MIHRFSLALAAVTITGTLAAAEVPAAAPAEEGAERHAVTLCALAIPLMNAYVLNYEYLLERRHGLAVRLEYAPMRDTDAVDGTELAAVFNYRFHLAAKMSSFFVGAYGRYRSVYGEGTAEGARFSFSVPEVVVGLNVGYRWMVWRGVNAVFSAGYGYAWTKTTRTPDRTPQKDALAAFADKNAQFMDAPFYGEFSVGYAF
jgi:hypothetical protein